MKTHLEEVCNNLHKYCYKNRFLSFKKNAQNSIEIEVLVNHEDGIILEYNFKCTEEFKHLSREKLESKIHLITKAINEKYKSELNIGKSKITEKFYIHISDVCIKIYFFVMTHTYERRPLRPVLILPEQGGREIFKELNSFRNNSLGKKEAVNSISLRYTKHKKLIYGSKFVMYASSKDNSIKDEIYDYNENIRNNEICIIYYHKRESLNLLNFEIYFHKLFSFSEDIKKIDNSQDDYMLDFQCNFVDKYFELSIYEKKYFHNKSFSVNFFI